MAYLEGSEICEAYKLSTDEADKWREDYPEFERLMRNGLLEDLDSDLPEVNDGSLAASLFKLAKRVIRKNMGGRAVALDRDDAWLTELANLEWENNILKNAKSKASPRRKWKDAVRKAAGYGSQPIITLFVERGNYTGADFIVPYAPDVKLEAGKDSDEDSDIIFWDCYFSRLQVKNMLEQAIEENKEAKTDPDSAYNKWDVEQLRQILKSKAESDRPGNEEHSTRMANGIKTTGYHFYIAFQRGVDAPFTMYFNKKDHETPVREWSNPDPTGDVPVHYLYCYQDFINPYGIGIVELAGGTQNILDYFRKADVLATQLGLRRPKTLSGDTNDTDFDSLVMEEDATWELGNAKLDFVDMADGVYQELPGRMSMYQTSLQKVLPTGESSISGSDSGDPNVGRTPQALKMAAGSLSIDDEDFTENVDECFAAVSKSMINTHFANMQGKDIRKFKTEEIEILQKAGIEFPEGEDGQPSRELEVEWDKARGEFDFEINPEDDKATDDATKLEGYKATTDFLSNPQTQTLIQMAQSGQPLVIGSKRIDIGELVGGMIALTTNNDKIVTDISPDELNQMAEERAIAEQEQVAIDAENAAPIEEGGETMPDSEAGELATDVTPEEAAANVQGLMEQFNVDQETAAAMLEAERQGWPEDKIMATFIDNQQPALEPMI